jgi:recombination protein RecT
MTDVAANVPAKRAQPMIALREFLDNRMAEIKTALPAHMSPERFIRVVLTAAQINPEILACERQSLWNACMRAANDGLLPDGVEGAIVPYKSKATWIPMYQGLLKKFRNSGEFKWVTAGIVHEGDEYDHWIDETGEHFRHRPSDDNVGKKVRRVYALATTKDGGSFIADLSLTEINKRKAMSRATREDAPWKLWEPEMQKKTALRVLSKLLPKSSDLDALMRRDEEALLGVESVDARRAEIAQPSTAKSTLDAFGALAADEVTSPTAAQPDEEDTPSTAAREGGGGQATQPGADEQFAAVLSSSSTEGTPAAADLNVAYERGKQDKAAGNRRTALPGEYRGAAQTKKADAWFAGYDGKPMPSENENFELHGD